jgi:hypothetical protein
MRLALTVGEAIRLLAYLSKARTCRCATAQSMPSLTFLKHLPIRATALVLLSVFHLFPTAFRYCCYFYTSGLKPHQRLCINVPLRLAVNSSVLPARMPILAILVVHTVSLTQQLPCSDPAGREPREVPAGQQGGQVLHECQPCGYLGEPLHNTGLAEPQCLPGWTQLSPG